MGLDRLASFNATVFGGEVAVITAITTQTGTSPTATDYTLPSDYTALRVWTGETPFDEPYFDLYVNRSGTTTKLRMNRFEARLISVAAGGGVGFSTSDGRTIHVAPDMAQATLETTFAATGTALCDKAGPPLWSPAAAHIEFLSAGQPYEIASTGTSEVVFVSEYDGTSWSPPRWLRLPASGGVRLKATFDRVALANYSGASLTVNAPTGTIIGGSSATMTLPMPTITGTTHAVSTLAQLKTAIAAAVAGDEIVLASGTYALDINVTQASFTANNGVGGRVGAEGILIRSATGAFADCTITCASAGVGDWSLTQTGATLVTGFKGITFNFTGATTAHFTLSRGLHALEACRFTGVATNINTFDFVGDGTASGLTLNVLRCQFDTGGGDLISGNNTGGTACTVRIIDCVAFGTGTASSHQCVTTHGQGIPLQIFGGNFYSAQDNALAPGSGSGEGRMYWFFGKTSDVSRACKVQDTDVFGCDLAKSGAVALKTGFTMGLVASIIRATFSEHVARTGIVEGCLFQHAGTGAYGMQVYPLTQTSSVKRFNVITGFSEGIRISDSASGAVGTVEITNTSVVSCTVGARISDTRLSSSINHLATKGSTTGMTTTADAMGRMTRSYNTLDPTISGFYSAGTGDITNADAALDSRYFPTAAGNCENNGNAALLDWVGGTDYEGYPLRLASSVQDRGARCRPRIIVGAELLPDIW
jgi:hypothetical protein